MVIKSLRKAAITLNNSCVFHGEGEYAGDKHICSTAVDGNGDKGYRYGSGAREPAVMSDKEDEDSDPAVTCYRGYTIQRLEGGRCEVNGACIRSADQT